MLQFLFVVCRLLQLYRCVITKTRLIKYIENITTKTGKFSDTISDIFHISAQNIDCAYPLVPPRRGGSNEYPQAMFWSGNKKNNVYPCKPQFYYIKVGFKGVRIIKVCFRDACHCLFLMSIGASGKLCFL